MTIAERCAANEAMRVEYHDWQGTGRDFVTLAERLNAAAATAARQVRAEKRERGCGQ